MLSLAVTSLSIISQHTFSYKSLSLVREPEIVGGEQLGRFNQKGISISMQDCFVEVFVVTDASKLKDCVLAIESSVAISKDFFGYFLSRKESNGCKSM